MMKRVAVILPLMLILSLCMSAQSTMGVRKAFLNRKPNINTEKFDVTKKGCITLAEMKDFRRTDAPADKVIRVVTHHDRNLWSANVAMVYNDNYKLGDGKSYAMGDSAACLSVPEGTYDVLVRYSPFAYYGRWYYVIKENIQTSGEDTITVDINPEEATNVYKSRTYLPSGNIADLNTYDENWMPVQGNLLAAFTKSTICKDGKEITSSFNSQNIYFRSGDDNNFSADNDFYVSPTSNRYTFLHTREAVDTLYNEYFDRFEFQGGSGVDSLANDPAGYTEYAENFKLPKENSDLYYCGFCTYYIYNNEFISGWVNNGNLPSEQDSPVKAFVSNETGTTPYSEGFKLVVKPLYTNIMTVKDDEGNESMKSYPLYGQTAVVSNDKVEYIADRTKTDEILEVAQYGKVDGYDAQNLYPGNDFLYFTNNQKKGDYGNSMPIMEMLMYKYTGANKSVKFQTRYLGRFGEERVCDIPFLDTHVTVNGDSINLDDYGSTYFLPFDSLTNVYDYVVTDTVASVDGMKGKSVMANHFDVSADDYSSPTLRMLQLRDADGNVTDRFDNATGAKVDFVAVDPDELMGDDGTLTWNFKKPSAVEISYAPYGTEDWQSLSAEELPEYGRSNFGYAYQAALDNVKGNSEDGWFNLKIRLEDETGNYQEQTICPAFKIDDTTMIQNVENLNGMSNNSIYDLNGRKITDASSISHLPQGIYILKNGKDGKAKKMVIK